MRKVFKYVIEVNDEVQEHPIPRTATEHYVGLNPADESQLAIWFVVDPDHKTMDRKFFVRGTGHPIPDAAIYMGSVHSGMFIWHIFEA